MPEAGEPEQAQDLNQELRRLVKSAVAQERVSKEELRQLVESVVAQELAARRDLPAPDQSTSAQLSTDESSDISAGSQTITASGELRQPLGFILPDFHKTGLTFIMGDDNLRDNSQYSVQWDAGQRPEYEDFFERIYGYSNTSAASTRLMLFHEEQGLLPNLTARIGLAFRVINKMDNIDDKLKTNIFEDRSYIDLDWLGPARHRVKLTLYPYNADNIALGYFRGLRWGTREVYPQIDDSTAVPGLQILYGYGPLSAYLGFKTHAQEEKDKLNREFVPKETTYGWFGGLGLRDWSGLSAHLQGAVIDKGENPALDDSLLDQPDDDRILALGVDGFVQYAMGAPLGDPLGINSYNDREWMVPSYHGEWAFRLRGEYSYLSQRLQNADYLATAGVSVEPLTAMYPAQAGAFEASMRWRQLRIMGLASLRTLSFLTFDSPGVQPFETISRNADTSAEVTTSLHADYKLGILWFGSAFGFRMPGSYTTYDASGQKVVTVIKDRITSDSISYAFDRTREVLPAGRDAVNMFFLQATLKARFAESVWGTLEYSYTRDHNRAKLVEVQQGGVGTGVFTTDWDDETVRNIHGLLFMVEGRF